MTTPLRPRRLSQIIRALAAVLLIVSSTSGANWNLSNPSSILIDSTTVPFNELSGVTYLGPLSEPGHHQFLAVQDEGGKLVWIDVELSTAGGLLSARSTAALTVAANMDFEGIAYTDPDRGSVFLAEENGPGVREFALGSGIQLQNVAIPSVFTNRRSNFGFESMARRLDGSVMWSANEEALAADGPLSTVSAGTTVRLLRMHSTGNDVTAGNQYAYRTDPIHVAGLASQRRSGLSELVALPDGTLLGLERSFDVSFTAPFYRSRIYEIDLASATDISIGPLATGLAGQTYTPVGKELLWSGQAGGANGQNLEGLCVGPRLADGNWLIVGVVDNSSGSDSVSFNTLVAFELSANVTLDFNVDGNVDGRDFLAWQRGFGTAVGTSLADGDGDRDGDVDAQDIALWSGAYGGSALVARAVPEPDAIIVVLTCTLAAIFKRASYIVSLA